MQLQGRGLLDSAKSVVQETEAESHQSPMCDLGTTFLQPIS